MNIAFIGCGYVSGFYARTLCNYPDLQLKGAYDTSRKNLEVFGNAYKTHQYESLDELLSDRSIDLVLNLTNPRNHFNLTMQCIEAGKHVYSEKPLAMQSEDARKLVELSRQHGVYLCSAPCSVLSETAETLGKAIRDGLIGRVRLIYANFDDEIIQPGMAPWEWYNELNIPWPAKDEFEVGCTYEHAGYVLTWLAAFFGPAKRVTSFAATLCPEKGIPVAKMAPDFTTGCIEYADGIVARITCGLLAPRDKSITVMGEKGILYVPDVRNDVGPVYFRSLPAQGFQHWVERFVKKLNRWTRIPITGSEWCFQKKLPLIRKPRGRFVSRDKPVDFCRGPAEMVAAIREKRECRLSAEFGLHIVELIETLQYPEHYGHNRKIISTFPPIQPLSV